MFTAHTNRSKSDTFLTVLYMRKILREKFIVILLNSAVFSQFKKITT